MPSPILARADALMQRRRQGESGPLDDLPVLTDTVEADDNLPVLALPEIAFPDAAPTEAPLPDARDVSPLTVDSPAEPTPAKHYATELASPLEGMDIDALALELSDRIQAKLHAEIPHLIHIAIAEYMGELNARKRRNEAR